MLQMLKTRVIEALKAKRDIEKDILRFIISEIQVAELRFGKSLDDTQISSIIKKTIERNEELLKIQLNDRLVIENEILSAILPKSWTEQQILEVISKLDLKSVPTDGKAIGLAMQALKSQKAIVDGKLVGQIVQKIRSEV